MIRAAALEKSDAKKCSDSKKKPDYVCLDCQLECELVEHDRMIVAEWDEVECKGCGKIL